MYVVLVFRSDVMDTAEVFLTTAVMPATRTTLPFSDGHVFTSLGACVLTGTSEIEETSNDEPGDVHPRTI